MAAWGSPSQLMSCYVQKTRFLFVKREREMREGIVRGYEGQLVKR